MRPVAPLPKVASYRHGKRFPMSGSQRFIHRSVVATLTFMLTGSITATIIHGGSTSPLGPLDWSLGDFASALAVAQASLFLPYLYLYKAVSVLDGPFDCTKLSCRGRHQNLKQILIATWTIYRPTDVLLRSSQPYSSGLDFI